MTTEQKIVLAFPIVVILAVIVLIVGLPAGAFSGGDSDYQGVCSRSTPQNC